MHEANLPLSTGTHYWTFTTYDPTTFIPSVTSGAVSLNYHLNGSASTATAGLSVTTNFASRTGVNQAQLNVDNATSAFTNGDWVEVLIAQGAVSTYDIAGTKIGHFYVTNGALLSNTKSDINAEVADVVATDTRAEPGQGAPGAAISLGAKIDYLYKAWRNKKTQTATLETLYADDGTTTDQKRTVSDDGTTLTSGEIGTGA